jgi:hypothetical protein
MNIEAMSSIKNKNVVILAITLFLSVFVVNNTYIYAQDNTTLLQWILLYTLLPSLALFCFQMAASYLKETPLSVFSHVLVATYVVFESKLASFGLPLLFVSTSGVAAYVLWFLYFHLLKNEPRDRRFAPVILMLIGLIFMFAPIFYFAYLLHAFSLPMML